MRDRKDADRDLVHMDVAVEPFADGIEDVPLDVRTKRNRQAEQNGKDDDEKRPETSRDAEGHSVIYATLGPIANAPRIRV
jgi:hypothetical protein